MVLAYILLLGLCFGSFVNALVWRLHAQAALGQGKVEGKGSKVGKPKSIITLQGLSIVKGRSMCSKCHHPLSALDLVPVLSWLFLRGKCRYCHAPIEDSPIVEIVTACLFLVSYSFWPYPFDGEGIAVFIPWLVILVGLVALAVYDLRWMLLPDRIVRPLTIFTFVALVLRAILYGPMSLVWHSILGALVVSGIFYFLFQVSKGRWIGGGDVKLGLVLGLIVGGPVKALLLIFVASCLATIMTIPLMLLGKAKLSSKLPFGPFLILATFIVFLFGNDMINWYQSLFLPL